MSLLGISEMCQIPQSEVVDLIASKTGLSARDVTLILRMKEHEMTSDQISIEYMVDLNTLKNFIADSPINTETSEAIVILRKAGFPISKISSALQLSEETIGLALPSFSNEIEPTRASKDNIMNSNVHTETGTKPKQVKTRMVTIEVAKAHLIYIFSLSSDTSVGAFMSAVADIFQLQIGTFKASSQGDSLNDPTKSLQDYKIIVDDRIKVHLRNARKYPEEFSGANQNNHLRLL